jgi:hypothetical protein
MIISYDNQLAPIIEGVAVHEVERLNQPARRVVALVQQPQPSRLNAVDFKTPLLEGLY